MGSACGGGETTRPFPTAALDHDRVAPAIRVTQHSGSDVDEPGLTGDDDEILELAAAEGAIGDTSGTVRDITRRAVEGQRSGTQLAFVTSFVKEWCGWATYYPNTHIDGR